MLNRQEEVYSSYIKGPPPEPLYSKAVSIFDEPTLTLSIDLYHFRSSGNYIFSKITIIAYIN